MFLVREYMKIQCFLVNVRIFSLSIPGTTATKRAYLHFVINWTLRNVSLYLTRTRQQQTNRKKKNHRRYFLSILQRIQFSWNKSANFFTNKIKFRTSDRSARTIDPLFPSFRSVDWSERVWPSIRLWITKECFIREFCESGESCERFGFNSTPQNLSKVILLAMVLIAIGVRTPRVICVS